MQVVYIYGNIDFTGRSAAATRMTYYAKAIANSSTKVFLVSSCANKFQKKDFSEIAENVFVLKNKKMAFGFLKTLRFLKNLNRFANEQTGGRTFILYPQSYFFLELFSVLYMIFLKRNSVYFELNEVKKYSSNFHRPMSIKNLKYSLKTIVYKTVFIVVDNLMRFFKGLVCISTNIETYGKRYNNNTIRIPILTDPEMAIASSSNTYRQDNYFNIGFSGSIIPSKENLFEFIEVVKKAKSNGYRLVFNLCGTLSEEDHKTLFAIQDVNPLLKYYGKLDEKEFSGFLSQQDLLVIPRGYTLQNNYGFSTKLSDYLNHQKMILITDISDNGIYIEDGVNGFIVPPNDFEKMYEKLTYILENYENLENEVVLNSRKTSKEKFDYRLYANSLRQFLMPLGIPEEPTKSYHLKS